MWLWLLNNSSRKEQQLRQQCAPTQQLASHVLAAPYHSFALVGWCCHQQSAALAAAPVSVAAPSQQQQFLSPSLTECGLCHTNSGSAVRAKARAKQQGAEGTPQQQQRVPRAGSAGTGSSHRGGVPAQHPDQHPADGPALRDSRRQGRGGATSCSSLRAWQGACRAAARAAAPSRVHVSSCGSCCCVWCPSGASTAQPAAAQGDHSIAAAMLA